MTRLEVLKQAGCTIGEAEIIGLKLDALNSDEERVAWIERHLSKFLTAIRKFAELDDCHDSERKANIALAQIQDCIHEQELSIAKDPYCEEVKMLKRNLAITDSVRTRLYRCPRGTYEDQATQAALEREAEDALVQAVAIKDGGHDGKR